MGTIGRIGQGDEALTELLYYRDGTLAEFTASIKAVKEAHSGRYLIELDRTAFYVEGGGQPGDRGTINGHRVDKVFVESERVWHEVEVGAGASAPLVGDAAHGVVDMAVRRDYSVQHTAQHILSQAFYQLFAADTSSFHLSPITVSIDLSRGDLTWPDVLRAEALANDILRLSLPVTVEVFEEQGQLPESVRKATPMAGPIRVVEVSSFDLCPCGGTHVGNSGEIGIIKVLALEKTRGKTRVEFCAGDRALRDYQERIFSDMALAVHLSVPYQEQPAATERMLAAEKDARREAERLKHTLLKDKAIRFEPAARFINGAFYIIGGWQESLEDAKVFLAMLVEKEPGVALAVIDGDPCRLALASSTNADAGAIFKGLLPGYGGKGGGMAKSAQGAVPREHVGALLKAIEERLSKWHE
jgi:alanyl-tRNA synthetase